MYLFRDLTTFNLPQTTQSYTPLLTLRYGYNKPRKRSQHYTGHGSTTVIVVIVCRGRFLRGTSTAPRTGEQF